MNDSPKELGAETLNTDESGAVLHCPACGYNLTGLPNNICPECGEQFDRVELRRLADLKAQRLGPMLWPLLWAPAAATLLGALMGPSVTLGPPSLQGVRIKRYSRPVPWLSLASACVWHDNRPFASPSGALLR